MPTQTVDLYEPGYRSLLFAHLFDGRTPLPTDSGGNGERLPWPFVFVDDRSVGRPPQLVVAAE